MRNSVAIILCMIACSAWANAADKDLTVRNMVLLNEVILPGYQVLAASTESLDANVIHSCGARRSLI